MNIELRKKAEHLLTSLNRIPTINSCELYGSLAAGTEDDMSDIDIRVDVSGSDNGMFMLRLPELLATEMDIIYYDFAPSLVPDKYIVSFAINGDNPFEIADIDCVATPHFSTMQKEQVKNEFYPHVLKLWVANLKHYARRNDCFADIAKMSRRLRIADIESKSEEELLMETLEWLESNGESRYEAYVQSCRERMEEILGC